MSDSRDFVDLTETTAIDDIPYHQLSVYHHLLYAVRHGYDFRHIPTASRDGYHATWPKISILLQLMAEQKYDLLVYSQGHKSSSVRAHLFRNALL